MIKRSRFIIMTGLTTLLCACQGSAEAPQKKESNTHKSQEVADQGTEAQQPQPATDSDSNQQVDMVKLSEAFGNFIGRNLQMPGIKFDLEGIIKGIRAGAEGKPSPLSEKEYESMMAAIQEKAFKELASKNLQDANAFILKNAKEPNVVELVAGKLQYTIIQDGKGAVVIEHSSPMINYSGRYLDGTLFGSSEETGGPITVPLDQTIQGFSKAVVGMKEGEKRKIFVHPDLGYGSTGQLPPNQLLIFEVEVVKANSSGEPADKQSASLDEKEDKNADFDDEDGEDDSISDSDDNDDDDDDKGRPKTK